MNVASAAPVKRRTAVLGTDMAYVEVGVGDPIVLLHGNPTSSYLWRGVLPHLTGLGRCIAPDLVGMGDSAAPPQGPDRYTFIDHRRYLDALLDGLGVRERVTLIVHDWGSALGFDWANRHRDRVRGIAYMEAIVRPMRWAEREDTFRSVFQALRSATGDRMVLDENFFIERFLPGGILRTLTDEEMTEYRRPYLQRGESRRPMLTWARQLPIEGEPADVAAIVDAYANWLSDSDVPKLFFKGAPGMTLRDGPRVEFCRSWPNQTEVTVPGLHFLQEDSPDDIGQAIARWLTAICAHAAE